VLVTEAIDSLDVCVGEVVENLPILAQQDPGMDRAAGH
jgi:hypothetical protein